MIIHFDTLKCAKMLRKAGFQHNLAEGFIDALSKAEIQNLYSKCEIDNMLSQSIEKVFHKQDEALEKMYRQHDSRLEKMLQQQRQDFDKRIELTGHRIETEISEIRSLKRWVVGTIITVGLGLAGFLSSLLRFTH